ncbi:hypothetical protein PHYBOEH_005465 [Phytophthora boehmeriae]|uniref:RxLR effector protein n=1 Tax=Phytophthora boehmeriae TaxID=109152 RepID=A0A8T1WR03_9STRA|nr:hypothetical protein PHYBOEH_005465 [Phytophthora boehmeriae]
MRLTNFLLLTTAVLLASYEGVSATTGSTQATLSTKISPNALQSLDAVHDGKRILRTKREEVDDGDDSDDNDDSDDDDNLDSNDEERMIRASSFKLLAPEAEVVAAAAARAPKLLSKPEKNVEAALAKIPGGVERVIGWKTEGILADAVKKDLLERGVSKTSDEWKAYQQYLAIELLAKFPPLK